MHSQRKQKAKSDTKPWKIQALRLAQAPSSNTSKLKPSAPLFPRFPLLPLHDAGTLPSQMLFQKRRSGAFLALIRTIEQIHLCFLSIY